jgi:RNA-directed DNA polymerase
MHAAGCPRPAAEGISFLGFVLYPQRRRLKRRKGLHYQRKLSGLLKVYARNQIGLDQITASVQGWVNHVRYANTVGLRTAILDRFTLRH